jgi:hypothetical protein
VIVWFESLPILASGPIVVGGFIVVTMVLSYLVDFVLPRDVRAQHNELAGFILAVIGVVYAVLLAFVAIGAWERFEGAERSTYHEAGMITIVYRDAGSFPTGHKLRAALRAYVERVAFDEWPKMQRGERSVEARQTLEAVDLDVRQLPVNTPEEQSIQQRMLDAMDQALTDRDARISMDATGINNVMWFVLVAGAFTTMAFTYLFGFKHTVMQQLMIGLLAFLIGLVLFMTLALDFPFRGALTVGPEAFENALHVFTFIGP